MSVDGLSPARPSREHIGGLSIFVGAADETYPLVAEVLEPLGSILLEERVLHAFGGESSWHAQLSDCCRPQEPLQLLRVVTAI